MKKIKISISLISVFLPFVSYAQLLQTEAILGNGKTLLDTYVIPLVFTLGLLFFFWGVAKYIRSAGQEKEEGRQIMVWGVVALFVMASVWGLVRFIRGEFNINDNSAIQIPKITP